MEFSQPPSSSQLDQDNYRCIQLGMGGSLQRGNHRGTLVPSGGPLPHQLLGDAGSLPSSSVLYEGYSSSSDSLPPYGQYHSNLLPEPQRRDNFALTLQARQADLAVVHVPEHFPNSQPPTWTPQHSSRQGVQDGTRQMGLATPSQNLSQDQPDLGTTCSRPVCIQTNTPVASILQLETRPSSLSNRCLSSELVREDLLCKSPMGPNVEVLSEVSHQQADVIIVAPVWKGQPWFPVLLSLLFDFPHLILPATCPILSQESMPPPFQPQQVQLAVWPTSGDTFKQKFSEQALELLLASWRQKSSKSYNSLFHKWECWCDQRSRNPISGPVVDISNFLAELYHEGYSYSSLNSYRSAISSVHEYVEGKPIGQHPQIVRILKGAYNLRPPTPRYSNTWKVSTVITWLDSIELSNGKLPLIDLSIKTVLLLSLVRPLRSADLANFLLPNLKYLPEGAIFMPTCTSKQSRVGKSLKEFFFPAFEANSNLCPVNGLKVYAKRTEPVRKSRSPFFLTAIPDHHPATAATIARWIKTGLSRAGIDTSIFKAHSICSASTSAAADAGVSVSEIMEAADWSSASVFEKFYYRPHRSSRFGHSVMASASNLHS